MRTVAHPEFHLVASCCRWPRKGGDNADIRSIAGQGIDWSLVGAITRRNRVSPLVYHALDRAGVEMPGSFRAGLSRDAHEAAKRSLTLARESPRLQQTMEAKSLPAMIVKGVPLAILAYGEVG